MNNKNKIMKYVKTIGAFFVLFLTGALLLVNAQTAQTDQNAIPECKDTAPMFHDGKIGCANPKTVNDIKSDPEVYVECTAPDGKKYTSSLNQPLTACDSSAQGNGCQIVCRSGDTAVCPAQYKAHGNTCTQEQTAKSTIPGWPTCEEGLPVIFHEGVLRCGQQDTLDELKANKQLGECQKSDGTKYSTDINHNPACNPGESGSRICRTVCAEGDAIMECPIYYKADGNRCEPDNGAQQPGRNFVITCRIQDTGKEYELTETPQCYPGSIPVKCPSGWIIFRNACTEEQRVNTFLLQDEALSFSDALPGSRGYKQIRAMVAEMIRSENFTLSEDRALQLNNKATRLFALQIAITVAQESCSRVDLSSERDRCIKVGNELGILERVEKAAGKITKGDFYRFLVKAANLSVSSKQKPKNFCGDIRSNSPLYTTFAIAKKYGFLTTYKSRGKKKNCLPNAKLSRRDALILGYKAMMLRRTPRAR